MDERVWASCLLLSCTLYILFGPEISQCTLGAILNNILKYHWRAYASFSNSCHITHIVENLAKTSVGFMELIYVWAVYNRILLSPLSQAVPRLVHALWWCKPVIHFHRKWFFVLIPFGSRSISVLGSPYVTSQILIFVLYSGLHVRSNVSLLCIMSTSTWNSDRECLVIVCCGGLVTCNG